MSLSEIRAPIHKNRTTTMGRIEGFFSSSSLFRNINLSNKIYVEIQNTKELTTFPILGPHGSWQNYSKEDILNATFTPVGAGQRFGPTWATHWFHVLFDPPPASWQGKEIHFRFASGTEAMVYDKDLNVLQGISPGFREDYKLTTSYVPNPVNIPLEFYVEMACNHISGGGTAVPGHSSMILPPDPNRFWTLSFVDLAVFSRENFNFLVSIEQLYGISNQMPDTHTGMQAMFVANEMVTLFSSGEISKGNELADAYFNEGVGTKVHSIYAMGHCHLDTAWLWPYDESIRKCGRSFSAQLELIEEYDFVKFVCSSAQHYAWVQEFYPDLYARIVSSVHAKKFIPVGGAWIELDGNIPSGESFIRQFYYGQKYFEKAFGPEFRSKEFWLPDTFGYSPQIPAILKHVGIGRFLTAKISWNLVNKFPNHSFWWEGIDGSRVLVHFPPGNNFNMGGTVAEILDTQNNSTDKGRSNSGVYLYGHGDGGGGPTRRIIERLKRVQNVDGMPKIVFSDAQSFFEQWEKEQHRFYRWCGELYLELHNGTYTTQGKIKWYNRKGEFLLKEIELLMAIAYGTGKMSKTEILADQQIVDSCWKNFLLNQFHDVLPGSCIEIVAEDAWKIYSDIFQKLGELRSNYFRTILEPQGTSRLAIYNPLPWEVDSVVFMKPDVLLPPPEGPSVQHVTLSSSPFENEGEGRFRVPSTFAAAKLNLNASGFTEFLPLVPNLPVVFTPGTGTNFGSYSNGKITLDVSIVNGKPVEALFLIDGQNKPIPAYNDYANIGISPGMIYYYDDLPEYWDAWDVMDYHLESRRDLDNLEITQEPENFAEGPIVAGYKWGGTFGANRSSFTRYTIMRADSPMIEYYLIVDWKENRKMIKVEFPLDILSREASYEIQYGHTKRPIHINTSWDMAKYEVCGHKWMDLSQADKGVTIITDSKYGWHVRGNHAQLSLLKSPKVPDANCDIHQHFVYYAVMPHKGRMQDSGAIQKAYELNAVGCNNVPLLPTVAGLELPANFVTSSNPAVIMEAIKVSNLDNSEGMNAICVRVYEAFGGSAETDLSVNGFTIAHAFETNGLEDVGGQEIPVSGNSVNVTLKPFQIRSFLFTWEL